MGEGIGSNYPPHLEKLRGGKTIFAPFLALILRKKLFKYGSRYCPVKQWYKDKSML